MELDNVTNANNMSVLSVLELIDHPLKISLDKGDPT